MKIGLHSHKTISYDHVCVQVLCSMYADNVVLPAFAHCMLHSWVSCSNQSISPASQVIAAKFAAIMLWLMLEQTDA